MHELDPNDLNESYIREAERIGDSALAVVEARYGTGYPHYQGGEDGGLAYHNRHHSAFVQEGAARMAWVLGLSPSERAISGVAAAAHDIVQRKARGVMERESAEWLAAEMTWLKMPEAAIRIGKLAILGTEPLFEDGRMTGQVAGNLAYPSYSAELIAKSVASADLGELYAPQGPLVGHDLFKEINGVSPADDPPMEKLLAFQQGQLWLADNYRFPHEAGEQVFGGLRGQVVEYTAAVLDQLERGEIETWDQLLAQDRAFMLAHS